MLNKVSILLTVLALSGRVVKGQSNEGPMIEMLNSMQQMLTGDGSYFDPIFIGELQSCWDNTHPDLKQAQDAAWQGMIDYFEMDGFGNDTWGNRKPNETWFENNATAQDNGIIIYEPCNYASNIAYYHPATELCRSRANLRISDESIIAIIQSFSFLGSGSAFYHGSCTQCGVSFDANMISILSYAAHQATLENLIPLGPSCVITDLNSTCREMSGIEIANSISDMVLTMPVTEWEDHIESLDMPTFFITFGGLVSSALTMAFEDETVDSLAPFLMDLLSMPEDQQAFILDDYIPEFRSLTADLQVGPIEKLELQGQIISTAIKLLYAFLWQEEYLNPQPPFVLDPEANELGARLIPVVNSFANRLNDFTYYEQNFQDAILTYPGDTWCNPSQYAHAKWHHESAAGLLDLIYTCDNVYTLTFQSMSTQSTTASLPSTTPVENPTTSSAVNGNLHSLPLSVHSIILSSIYTKFRLTEKLT